MKIPHQVKYIITTLESAGYEAFIVGGCVRDVIRNVPPKDWDIATSATPVQAKSLFKRTIDTGIKHGTITVLLDRLHYEVTTYRIDGEYLDNRRPETVEFTGNIEDDLSRRDFTMNAIAYNPKKGFVDPFGGQEDIDRNMIRCVGDPIHRFKEDALRMLRAIRFSGVTGFAVCVKLLDAISTLRQNLSSVSPEQIREELGKLITSPNPQAVGLLHRTGLLPFVLRGKTYGGNLSEVIPWLKNCPSNEAMRMALFLHWAGNDCETILRDLRFDNKSIKEISQYVQMMHKPIPYSRYEIKKILRHVPQDLFQNLLNLKRIIYKNQTETLEAIRQEALDIFQTGECFTLQSLAINGGDLNEIGIPPGKEMGSILEYLLDAVMRNPELNAKSKLLSLVQISTS